jgi:hypothetical protein
LEVTVAPAVGGRIVQIQHLGSGHQFLWNNSNLSLTGVPRGGDYDSNFFGGIDELLPNDLIEAVDGVEYPDHGELWTTPLEWAWDGDVLVVRGLLELSGLLYERRLRLGGEAPLIDLHYRIENRADSPRHFLWKLHAAMNVKEGDLIDCPARHGQVVDLDYSRFNTTEPFAWPTLQGEAVNVIPPQNGTVDFYYLYGLQEGRMAWRRPSSRLRFEYRFDTTVFPYAWLFASQGGFGDHYTAILEPCTTMPISVNDAIPLGQCSRLAPGEVLETSVTIFAGVDE